MRCKDPSVATPCRHTFSGAVVVGLFAASAWLGGVPAADAVSTATSAEPVAPDACPPSWPALHAGPPTGAFDGNVSVLVGGNLLVSGSAAGAEGTVVALGDATFARDVPGPYEVGLTALGSQVTPYAGSDMLVVGGSLSGGPGTHVDVGQAIGGDVVVGGSVAAGADIDTHGGRVDAGIADATVPYRDLAGQLAGKSASYAGLASTGSVDVSPDQVLMTGDGVSNTQVFNVDASALAAGSEAGRGNAPDAKWSGDAHGAQGGHANRSDEGLPGRSLQLVGVPDGATVVVNITGDAVDLDIDSVLSATGAPIDPLSDPAFGALATHLIWNAPTATTVDVSGLAQLPGSLLVPTPAGTTTISNQGTNGRILVGGNLVHTGAGEMHAYPFLADPQLGCAADPVHLTSLTLGVVVVDQDNVVDQDRVFEGRYQCNLGGADVTPADNTWRMRAGGNPKVVSNQIPSGASCTVTERLDLPPAPFRSWADFTVSPDVVVVAKREARGFVITNKVKGLPQTPTETPTQTQNPPQTEESSPTESVAPPPPPPTIIPSSSSPTPSSIPEPTNRPPLASSPSASPSQPSVSSPSPTSTSDTAAPHADAPNHSGPAGPFTTTAPFTLRGAFVWGPLLMLSLLTLLVRVRRRPTRLH